MKCPSCFSDNEDGAEGCSACGRSLSPAVKPGTVLASRYEVLSVLGKGGMGVVYKARDRVLEEEIAIKVLRSDVARSPEMARRFRSEIRLARKVTHRNVCRIHEYGEHEGLRYISMELIEGQDLRQLLRQSKSGLPPDEAFEVAIQISKGLQAIHDVGIVHRDLKAANIMRDARGVVKLMDFGIAKQEGGTTSTAIGDIVGTPEYMSPEQARGQEVDARSDIYALSVVIYEIFSGDVPFRGETPVVTIYKHLTEEPPTEGPGAPAFPAALVPVLRRGLAKRPSERFSAADDLAEALRSARARGVPESALPAPKPSAPDTGRPGPAAAAIRGSPTRQARVEPLRMPAAESPPTPPPVTPTPRLSTPRVEPGAEPYGAEPVPARPTPVPVAVASVAPPPARVPAPVEAGDETRPLPVAAAAPQEAAASPRESREAFHDTPPTPFRVNLDDWTKGPDTAPPTPLPPPTLPPLAGEGPPSEQRPPAARAAPAADAPPAAGPPVRERTQPIARVAVPVPEGKAAPASRFLVATLIGIPLLLMVVGILVVGRLMRGPAASPPPGPSPSTQVTEEVLTVPAEAPKADTGQSGAPRRPPPSTGVSSPPPRAEAPVTAIAQGAQTLPAPAVPPTGVVPGPSSTAPAEAPSPSSSAPAPSASAPRPSEAPPAKAPAQELSLASVLVQAEGAWTSRAYEEAARLYDNALRLDPSNPQATAGRARARWAASAVKRVFATEGLTVNVPAQVGKALAGGFETEVVKGSDFSCDISFEVSPPVLRPEGPYSYAVRVSLASMNKKRIKLKSIQATLTVDGVATEQAPEPRVRLIEPMQRALVAEISGSWSELLADWSLKFSATGDKGDACHRTLRWR